MFWGLIMEPNKRYTQVVEKPFHISQAAMDISTGDKDPCQVMVVVEGKNYLVCTLQKDKNIQVPLDLYFKAGDAVAFLTNGNCNVHLTGYLDPEFEEDEEDEEEEEEEEAPALVPAKNKRKLDSSNTTATSKKSKKEKKSAKAESSDSDEDEDKNQLQKFLEGEDIDTDENDDSFKMKSEDDSDEDSDDEDEEEGEEEEDENDEKEENESSEEAETTIDTSKDESKVDTSKLTKSQKRRLKKKLQKQGKEQPQVNGVDKPKQEKKDVQQQKAEKKKEKKEQDAEAGEKKEKKSLSGGVQIEDIKVGSGPAAKPGKNVMVYYEGRLKQNNKMFDNCMKGPGFKFRLGAKEVISGWDIGVAGMKVGGKRKIICPPAMAYGAKGSPPVIPPNSTLVFEVELKNVK